MTSAEFVPAIKETIEQVSYPWIHKHRGSISAEHGIGFHKRNDLHYSKSHSAIQLMKQMKALMDPNNILNPYKVLP